MNQLKVGLPLLVLLAAAAPLLEAQAGVKRPVAKATVKMAAPQARALRALDKSASNMERLNKIHADTVKMNRQILARYAALKKKLANLEKLAARPGTTRAQLADAIRQAAQVQSGAQLNMIQLQSLLSTMNSNYTAASNMMKAQDDAIKSMINNIR